MFNNKITYRQQFYFDVVLEASKGLAERVRKITVLKLDGKLFDSAFSTKDTYIFFNSMQTESERRNLLVKRTAVN